MDRIRSTFGASLNLDSTRGDIFADGHRPHLRGKSAEYGPIVALAIEVFPKRFAVVDQQYVVAEHVMGDFRADKPRVHHEGNFFEEADEVPAVLNRLFGDVGAVVVNQLEKLLEGLLLKEAPSHLDELVGSGSVVLSSVLEQALPKRDERYGAANDDRNVFEQADIHGSIVASWFGLGSIA